MASEITRPNHVQIPIPDPWDCRAGRKTDKKKSRNKRETFCAAMWPPSGPYFCMPERADRHTTHKTAKQNRTEQPAEGALGTLDMVIRLVSGRSPYLQPAYKHAHMPRSHPPPRPLFRPFRETFVHVWVGTWPSSSSV